MLTVGGVVSFASGTFSVTGSDVLPDPSVAVASTSLPGSTLSSTGTVQLPLSSATVVAVSPSG